MEKIKTATGKTFDCDYFVLFDPLKQLDIYVHNVPFMTVASVFSNPKETVQMWFGNQYASQYTKLVSIAPEGNMVFVQLRKE